MAPPKTKNIHTIVFRVDGLTQEAFREAMRRSGQLTLTDWVRKTCEAAAAPIIARMTQEVAEFGRATPDLNLQVIDWRKRGYSRQAIAAKMRMSYGKIDNILREAGL